MSLIFGGASACAWLNEAPVEDLGSTGDGPVTPAEPVDKEHIEDLDPGFGGRWVGYVGDPFRLDENGQPLPAVFPSGSTEVTLDYRFGGELGLSPFPSIVFGARPEEQPRTGVSYPAGVQHYYAGFGLYEPFDAPIVEGYRYPLSEAENPRFPGYDPGRTSLMTFGRFTAFSRWCNAQEPQPMPDGSYSCLAAVDFGSSTALFADPLQGETCVMVDPELNVSDVDCNYATMCLTDLCFCDVDYCALDKGDVGNLFLELRGDEIVATITGASLDTGYPGWYKPMGTLHLFRVVE